MEKEETEYTYTKLKEKIIKTGEIGTLYYCRDLADKFQQEGKITLAEAADIHIIFALRR